MLPMDLTPDHDRAAVAKGLDVFVKKVASLRVTGSPPRCSSDQDA